MAKYSRHRSRPIMSLKRKLKRKHKQDTAKIGENVSGGSGLTGGGAAAECREAGSRMPRGRQPNAGKGARWFARGPVYLDQVGRAARLGGCAVWVWLAVRASEGGLDCGEHGLERSHGPGGRGCAGQNRDVEARRQEALDAALREGCVNMTPELRQHHERDLRDLVERLEASVDGVVLAAHHRRLGGANPRVAHAAARQRADREPDLTRGPAQAARELDPRRRHPRGPMHARDRGQEGAR
jgi:hypothetical protein